MPRSTSIAQLRSHRRLIGPIAVATLTATLAACSSQPPATIVASTGAAAAGQVCCMSTPTASVVNGIATAHNGWDIALVYWMTPHDAVGSQMAALAPAQAASQQVKDIAAEIDDATGPKYLTMSAMATAWGQPVPSTDPADAAGHDHGGGVSEAATAESLIPLSGAAFDAEFVKLMLVHHQAAIPIAQATIDNGENAQAKELAAEVIRVQTVEIGQLEQLAGTLAS